MRYRLLEHRGEIYLVVGFGYDITYDPPEVFHCVRLRESLFRSLMVPYEITVPLSEAVEITDKKRLLAILALYGD